jgi:hypothetical protein
MNHELVSNLERGNHEIYQGTSVTLNMHRLSQSTKIRNA